MGKHTTKFKQDSGFLSHMLPCTFQVCFYSLNNLVYIVFYVHYVSFSLLLWSSLVVLYAYIIFGKINYFVNVIYRKGDERSGTKCHLETLPGQGYSLVPSDIWEQFKIANAVLLSASSNEIKFEVLNVTSMSARRKDGHSSLYNYPGPHIGLKPIHHQDCTHWCLPGVPDAWNELLYALFIKHSLRYKF